MISKEEVQNLAQLVRLQLTEEETASLQRDISNILDYVGQVSSVNAAGEKDKPVLRNVMRADEPRPEGDQLAHKEEALRAAFPKQKADFNIVRKIIQKDE
ncbi:Asp-tRNA(Asn)/Glu-tRNA(Gln) amidotransferase subunit GatC [Candidatus Parcubacteria bacterium]|nr:Asp-tRNA(Asn)/Glu-tRNA(Gln) amidotransferase subunit GatC [Candidatus Parcubacteria bacterium]